ncbi:MAG: hypothetical protein CME59_09665 [Halioglobus sp.]|nr:hypothetical protein [Halioglobus sp.]|tara:strand:+ start:5472 stop:6434 length:963 start_codon:yes stop_codon:yes gene_type:complete
MKYLLCVLVCLSLAGAAYQSIAERADRRALPGSFIQVGDNTYYLLCKGDGERVLLFESGRWGWHADWTKVWPLLPAQYRACTYDRLGLGWSSKSHGPVHSGTTIDELHKLLHIAGIDQKLIIVGHSLGGYYARKFAARYPEQIAGLVLLDATHEEAPARMTYAPEDFSQVELCSLISWSGVLRISGTMEMLVPKGSSAEQQAQVLSVANRSQFCSGLLNAAQGIERELRTAGKPEPLADIPLAVVRRGKKVEDYAGLAGEQRQLFETNEPVWYAMQRELASLSSRSRLLVAPHSGHNIQLESPGKVVEAIEWVDSRVTTY